MLRLILLFFEISLKNELTFFLGSVIKACPRRVFSFKNLFSFPFMIWSFLSSGTLLLICFSPISKLINLILREQ